jgi:hypothetical protein
LRAIDAFLAGLIDYAGLFPPAAEAMRAALEHYASHRTGEDRSALGRFIVPFDRLTELEEQGKDLLPRGPESEPWRLSVILGGDIAAAGRNLLDFNRRHASGSPDGHAVVEVVELKAGTVEAIQHAGAQIPGFFTPYFEIPADGDLSSLISGIANIGASAKIRTGGVTPDAFPAAGRILEFMTECRQHSVAFKATAGLHHPVGGQFSLTYEPDSAIGAMYGFLNLFLASAFVYLDLPIETAHAVLEETDREAFTFSDEGITWRETTVDVNQIKAFRAQMATSFGSCSFREPIDEIAALGGTPLAQNR